MGNEIKRTKALLEEEISKLDQAIKVHLTQLGDAIAKELGYEQLLGDDAANYYLIQKHNWTPAVINGMSREERELALHQELQAASRQQLGDLLRQLGARRH